MLKKIIRLALVFALLVNSAAGAFVTYEHFKKTDSELAALEKVLGSKVEICTSASHKSISFSDYKTSLDKLFAKHLNANKFFNNDTKIFTETTSSDIEYSVSVISYSAQSNPWQQIADQKYTSRAPPCFA